MSKRTAFLRRAITVGLMALAVPMQAYSLEFEPRDVEAGAIDEIRMGRGVYNQNCAQCHAAPRQGSGARSPEAVGFWEMRLSSIGLQRMTQIVKKTHGQTDGIGEYVFDDSEILRGAVRFMAYGGEGGYLESIEKIKAALSVKNAQLLDEAVSELGVEAPIVWGTLNDDYRRYHYMGPIYPLEAALSDVVDDKMARLLSETVYIPSKRGEFELLEDYQARIALDREAHEQSYAELVSQKASFLHDLSEDWLNVLAGNASVPLDVYYDPDEQLFTLKVWQTPNKKRAVPLDDDEKALERLIEADTDDMVMTIPVPIELARRYKARLSIEDPDNKPAIFIVYARENFTLRAEAALILWRDSNEVEVVRDLSGSLTQVTLTLSEKVARFFDDKEALLPGVRATR